jgi:TPR repeat protein
MQSTAGITEFDGKLLHLPAAAHYPDGMRVPYSNLIGLSACAILLAACAAPSHEEIQAGFDAGLKAYDAGDYKTAYKTWGKIGEYDLAALRNVALMLRKGQGVDKDPETALKKMLQAADLGLVTAQADAGEMIANGEAGPPDKAAAVPLLGRAAAAGHPIAAFELAMIYEEGQAVPQDLKQACRLYRIGAGAGIAEAEKRLAALGSQCSAPAQAPAAPSGPTSQ